MTIDIVRGELERVFSLDELLSLTTELLGLAPEEVGGAASKASYARALTDWCVEADALDALLDAVLASRSDVDAKLRGMVGKPSVSPEELKPGETFGPFTIVKKLAEGPRALVYSATRAKDGGGTADVQLKVYRRDATQNRAGVRRFVTHARLASRIRHENLPSSVEVGLLGRRLWVATSPVEGQPLSSRVSRTGPLHLNEARGLLRGVLGALGAVHEQKLTHGAIKLENVFVGRDREGAPRAVLVDFGSDRLGGSLTSLSVARSQAPEVLRGAPPSVASDLYGFGCLLFELLTGKPPFAGDTAADVAVAHLTREPAAPSTLAPRGWVSKELDELTLRLLAKAPTGRPRDTAAVLETLEPKEAVAKDGKKVTIAEEALNDRVDLLLASPDDPDLAMSLESAVEQGADPKRVAEALTLAADQIEAGESDEDKAKATEAKKSLLFRAARILESNAKDLDGADSVYKQILELDPDDDIAFIALEELRKGAGKHEELVEMLLERSEKSESHSERARCLNEIGHLYIRELDDKEQGVFALAQAAAQDTLNDDYALGLERAAGNDMKLWSEALSILSQATTHPRMPPEAKIALFLRLGRWYSEKVARPDLGLPCYQAVLTVDPSSAGALEGLTQVYRRAQQWQELGQVLISRADRAPTAAEARDLRAEAADLLETRLNDAGRARDLYEVIFNEDPGHEKATEALARIYQRLEDHAGLAKILERRVGALRGEKKVEAMCRLAELHEDQLNDMGEATRRYEAALELDRGSLTALKGLDRIFNRAGRYKELLDNLERQLELAATPRQKINLLERIAGIHDEEFLDHGKAAETLERLLAIDPAHEASITALVRHYRVLDRWEDVVALYERHLKLVTEQKRQIELLLALGRVLLEQVGSPERARKAYERILELDANHGGALEALASVRAAMGDSAAALAAIESLAQKAAEGQQKADLWIRAAKMLEERGDKDGAIERYKLSLDAQPGNPTASVALRNAYLARGDATSAVELIARELDVTEGKVGKARLHGEMALLLREKIKDDKRAQQSATKAIDLDPTSMLGLLVTGDIAYEAGRMLEAAKAYESLANRVDALPEGRGLGVLSRYIDALKKSGSADKAVGVTEKLIALAPNDPKALGRAAKVQLDAGEPREAARLFKKILDEHEASLGTDERADVMLGYGQALLGAGDPDGAVAPLLEAADLRPESEEPLLALCKVHEAKKDWEEVVRLKTRRLDVVSGDERWALLLEIGDIVGSHVGDRNRAAKSFVAALEEKPDDRKTLTKLMQLYSEEKDWSKLIEVVLRLASKIDEPKQKSKYLHTAAIVSMRQLEDLEQASRFYDDVMMLDPENEKAFAEAIEVRTKRGDHEGLETLLKVDLERASERGDTAKMLATFDSLADVYLEKLGWTGDGIDALEAAQTLEPDNEKRNDRLAALYASDPAQYLEKAVAAQMQLLRKNPYKPDSYRLLRKLYTEVKRADPAWCLCQALTCINTAEPDEERFYRRMRADGALAAADRMSETDWFEHLMHEDANPLITAIFTVIEPAVLRKNGQALESLGYSMVYALDLSRHPYPMSQTLHYAAGVLGMEPPLTFQSPNDPGGLSFLHSHTPAIVLGHTALASEVPQQAAVFIAARHLTYYRPALFLRHLVPTGTGLRAWLFAAIKLISPNFPVSAELEGPVRENLAVLEPMIVGGQKDHLTSAVTKLLAAGAIDLKKWIAAVDLSADRAGFLLANDLELAREMIDASDEASSVVRKEERARELLLFSVSEAYFHLRRRLGAAIDL